MNFTKKKYIYNFICLLLRVLILQQRVDQTYTCKIIYINLFYSTFYIRKYIVLL